MGVYCLDLVTPGTYLPITPWTYLHGIMSLLRHSILRQSLLRHSILRQSLLRHLLLWQSLLRLLILRQWPIVFAILVLLAIQMQYGTAHLTWKFVSSIPVIFSSKFRIAKIHGLAFQVIKSSHSWATPTYHCIRCVRNWVCWRDPYYPRPILRVHLRHSWSYFQYPLRAIIL